MTNFPDTLASPRAGAEDRTGRTTTKEDKSSVIILRRTVVAAIFVLLTLHLEDCSKKPSNNQASLPVIPDSLKRYPFRSANIELHYGGSASGKQMIYIDDFGQKETTVDSLTMKMMDMEMPNYKMQIRKGDSVYQIDYVRGMATRGVNHLSSSDEKDMAAMGESIAGGMGMKKDSAEEIVAGQKCTVWSSEQLGTKSWMWNNLVLKSESTVGNDKILLGAVSVRLDVPVPSVHFDAPQDVRYTTTEDIQSMLNEIDKKSGKNAEDEHAKHRKMK